MSLDDALESLMKTVNEVDKEEIQDKTIALVSETKLVEEGGKNLPPSICFDEKTLALIEYHNIGDLLNRLRFSISTGGQIDFSVVSLVELGIIKVSLIARLLQIAEKLIHEHNVGIMTREEFDKLLENYKNMRGGLRIRL